METQKPLNIENIRAIKVLGKGAMGTVFLAHDTSSDPKARFPFALKAVDKSTLKPDAQHRARWEMSVLSSVNHPFLPTLLGSLEAHDLICWAIPYCPGGDLNVLRSHQNDRVFSSYAIKFYLAEIVCALDHLHSMGIAYRDLKPENVLVQRSGHVTLTDFDLSRKLATKNNNKNHNCGSDPDVNPTVRRIFTLNKAKSARVSPASRRRESFAGGKRSNSFVGTEEYVSPEVVVGKGHEFGVDWWALGVLGYEMLYGRTPFRGKCRKETFQNVLMKRPEFVGKRTALIDLIERLLEKDPSKRLGHHRGAEEIKEHEFFRGLRWDLLTEVQRPPFVPSMDDFEGLTEKVTFDVREYLCKSRAPSSIPPSPVYSSTFSSEDDRSVSLTEF